ncbi:hypothetical protein [Haloarcula laminariae]|uniref:hypothetical protein n=1 Tax=Haloarcula laminariae TaxID=2961577 RepID=UPI002405736C|nr:hypothetical protein [Halomicroarcula sp. FL173]
MLKTLIQNYREEYREADGDFDHRIIGYGLIGIAILGVNAMIATTVKNEFGLTDSAVFLLIILAGVLLPFILWYPMRKVGF